MSKLEPIYIINGKVMRLLQARQRCCKAETLPHQTPSGDWYKTYAPTGEFYVEMWDRAGKLNILPGRMEREVRPSGRLVFRLNSGQIA